MTDYDELQPLIIDMGSGMTKAGFSGSKSPRAVFPTIEDEAQAKRGILRLIHPFVQGEIVDFNGFERMMHHSFYNELRVCPEEHPVLLSECPLNKKVLRKKINETLFEIFNVPALYLVNTAVSSLVASHKTRGVVLGMGYDVCYSAPVFDGYAIPHAIFKLPLGGKDITQHMVELLKPTYEMTTSAEREIVRDMKERLCFVPLDVSEEMQKMKNDSGNEKYKKDYELPDGQKISVDKERFLAPEILFSPEKFSEENEGMEGIVDLCLKSINKCDVELKESLYEDIVISGGSSYFSGIVERITQDVKRIGKKKDDLHRKFYTWFGMDLISRVPNLKPQYVTADEYDEYGSEIIARKCFCGFQDGIVSFWPRFWTTSDHLEFSERFQKRVILLLMCSNRDNSDVYVIPEEIIFIICSFMKDEWKKKEKSKKKVKKKDDSPVISEKAPLRVGMRKIPPPDYYDVKDDSGFEEKEEKKKKKKLNLGILNILKFDSNQREDDLE